MYSKAKFDNICLTSDFKGTLIDLIRDQAF